MAFRSLTTRFIFWTLLASGAVFAATLVASDGIARETAITAAQFEATQAADRLANRVGSVLSGVEESARLLAAVLETLEPDPQAVEALLRRFVASEPDVYGAAAAYAPGAYAPRRELFAAYVFGPSGEPSALRTIDLAMRPARYTDRPWYQAAAAGGQPVWSEPYVDEGASGQTVVTYSVPFFSGTGGSRRLRGVATAEVPLEFLSRIVREVHPGQTGRAIVLSRAGRILALSQAQTLVVDSPFLEQLPPDRRAAVEPMIRRMLAGDTGFARAVVGGQQGRVIYQPLGHAGWALGVFYPERELMAGARRLRLLQATLGLVGLGILTLVMVALSHRLTAPLRELAGAARGLGANLEAELPPTRSEDELGALATAFHEMQQALHRYVRDLEATTKAKERFESELAIARRIQMDMLPSGEAGGPEAGYEVAALLEPAREVGGDLFDHFTRDRHVFFILADVSGKGVPAALFMARTKTLFDSAARLRDPTEMLGEVNRGLCRENAAGMFVTAVCGVLALETGELRFACAGHEPPIRLGPGGRAAPFAVDGGTVLGLFAGAAYPANRVRLAPGEALFAFTDGVDEAFDESGRLFGTERLIEALRPCTEQPPARVNGCVRAAVRAFAGSARQSDDITMLLVRYLGPPPLVTGRRSGAQ